MNPDTLIELKLLTLHSLQSTGMTWWASSVVFCASVIAAVWNQRKTLVKRGFINWLGFAIGFFFISIVSYGAILTVHCLKLRSDVKYSGLAGAENFLQEFMITAIAYAIATTSFIIVTVSWFMLVHKLKKMYKQPEKRFDKLATKSS